MSDSQVWRLVTGGPERLNLRVMVVLREILACTPGELVARRDVPAALAKEPASGAMIDRDLQPKRRGSNGPRHRRDRARRAATGAVWSLRP